MLLWDEYVLLWDGMGQEQITRKRASNCSIVCIYTGQNLPCVLRIEWSCLYITTATLGLVAASPVWWLPGLCSIMPSLICENEATFYLDSVPWRRQLSVDEWACWKTSRDSWTTANIRFSSLSSILDHSKSGYLFSRSSSKLIRQLKAVFARCAIKAKWSTVLGKPPYSVRKPSWNREAWLQSSYMY